MGGAEQSGLDPRCQCGVPCLRPALGGGMVTYIIDAQYGLGRHRDTILKEHYKMYLRMTFLQALVSTIGSLLFLKLSIGFSLIRLSQQKVYTRVIWGFIGFRDKDLNPVCLPVKTHKAFALLNTSCNIFTDIAAVMVGIVKTVCQNVFRGQYDQSFYNRIQFWGFLQINIGIIAACAPTLRPLVAGILQLSTSNTGARYPSQSRYGNGYGGPKNTGLRSQRNNRSSGWVKADSGHDEYEMDDGRFGGHGGECGDQIRPDIGVAHGGSRSGSEEMIIQGVKGEEKKGIVRRTVVTVV
ncbi:Integral membrane protein [Emericellopsis cladophorae]|uniref:Integral membrane protein n=1 Tax=Emericellopsis cladophorae TaxID=2686198 RepID=A0A9Q0BD97_9HYPO|nr:Integral membrane protein [Emericellopsis cladophorae]KAI6779959.1 Integral membrane protein [Emericellopsis cladophorae]